jgi:putative transposase
MLSGSAKAEPSTYGSQVRCAFIERVKAHHAIAMPCRVLAVSVSGFYAWRPLPPSARIQADAMLTEQTQTIHRQSRQTYGAPRIRAELIEAGVRCSRKRVARLMRAAEIVGRHRRRHVVAPVREPTGSLAPDHLQRQFVAARPNERWTADITYVPTWSGFLYVAVALDVFGRRIVGGVMAEHLCTRLVLSALDRALWNRRPAPGVIHHSDHGCQYTSIAFGRRCQAAAPIGRTTMSCLPTTATG